MFIYRSYVNYEIKIIFFVNTSTLLLDKIILYYSKLKVNLMMMLDMFFLNNKCISLQFVKTNVLLNIYFPS